MQISRSNLQKNLVGEYNNKNTNPDKRPRRIGIEPQIVTILDIWIGKSVHRIGWAQFWKGIQIRPVIC